jgi:hypothetical protein
MIIAQRRPRRSPIQPQKLVAKKTRRLKSKTGVDATLAGLALGDRWFADSPVEQAGFELEVPP